MIQVLMKKIFILIIATMTASVEIDRDLQAGAPDTSALDEQGSGREAFGTTDNQRP